MGKKTEKNGVNDFGYEVDQLQTAEKSNWGE